MRSTVATYANVHDELRKIFARTPDAKKQIQSRRLLLQHRQAALPHLRRYRQYQPGRAVFARCEYPLPGLPRQRYWQRRIEDPLRDESGEAYTLPEIMDMDVRTALSACKDWKPVSQRLNVLNSLGLGYLTLGEETPGLSAAKRSA